MIINEKIKGWENRQQEIKDAEERLRKTVEEINKEFKELHELMYGKEEA